MIKPNIEDKVSTLKEFYDTLSGMQASAHFNEYIEHHKPLKKCAEDPEVNIIKEIGVCQGVTLAALMMTKPKKLVGYDIMPKYFMPYKKLFDEYAKNNNVDFDYIVMSSHDKKSVSKCDLLHIDSLHDPVHLRKELELHAPKVSKYIVFHDTANFKGSKGLLPVIADYITRTEQSWQIIDHYPHRVGYTAIKRVNRLRSHNE
jgi:hypothetical protein